MTAGCVDPIQRLAALQAMLAQLGRREGAGRGGRVHREQERGGRMGVGHHRHDEQVQGRRGLDSGEQACTHAAMASRHMGTAASLLRHVGVQTRRRKAEPAARRLGAPVGLAGERSIVRA